MSKSKKILIWTVFPVSYAIAAALLDSSEGSVIFLRTVVGFVSGLIISFIVCYKLNIEDEDKH